MPAKNSWEKSSPELADWFGKIAPKAPGVELKKMFGYPVCFVNGKLFTGLFKQSMMFRLSDSDCAELLKGKGAADFEPMPGRKMKGYVLLADPLKRDRNEIEPWIKRSLEFARALPEKSKAKSSAKKSKE